MRLKQKITTFFFVVFLMFWASNVWAKDDSAFLPSEQDLSSSDADFAPSAGIFDFLLKTGICRIEHSVVMECPLVRKKGNDIFSFYGGVLGPGTVTQTGSVGFVFHW